MDTGQIKLGASKELSRKPLSGVLLEGFFYAGALEEFIGWEGWHSYNYGEFAPAAPNFSDNQRAVAQYGRALEQTRGRGRLVGTFLGAIDSIYGGSIPTCSIDNFYDIPSQKRDARCTNILQTGALLTVRGEGQRLRKGFQNGDVENTYCYSKFLYLSRVRWARQNNKSVEFGDMEGILPILESLSSAAKLRHSARNTRLREKVLCLACTHRI